MQKLGYELLGNCHAFDGSEKIMLRKQDSQISLIPSEKHYIDPAVPIIINTDDCLMDCYILKEKGVKFMTEPEYIADGLAATFFDPSGNQWRLLEKREYEDI